jgi:hypothetical protein
MNDRGADLAGSDKNDPVVNYSASTTQPLRPSLSPTPNEQAL